MTAIPIDVELGAAAPAHLTSKLLYLEKANLELEERCEELEAAAKVNKQMLGATLQQLALFQAGKESPEGYRGYAEKITRDLCGQIQELNIRLKREGELRRKETSRVLISEQIREEESAFYNELLKEYEAKILELTASIQEKERHVQYLEEAESDMKCDFEKPRLPTREIMKLINDYDINLTLVERFKEENEALTSCLSEEKAKNKRLAKQLGLLRGSSQREGLIDLSPANKSEVKVGLHSDKKDPGDMNGTTQAGSEATSKLSQTPKGKGCRPKKNQTLFENMVVLYKREQVNAKLVSRKYEQLKKQLADETCQKLLLQSANNALQNELKACRSAIRKQEPQRLGKPDSTEHTVPPEKVPSDKSLQDNSETDRKKAEDRKKFIAELYSRFRRQLVLLEEHLNSITKPRKKLSYSLSCYELASPEEPEPPTDSSYEESWPQKQSAAVVPCDISHVIKLEDVLCVTPEGKGQTFGDYFGRRRREDDSFLKAFEGY